MKIIPQGQGPQHAPKPQLPGTKPNSRVEAVKAKLFESFDSRPSLNAEAEQAPPMHPEAKRMLDAKMAAQSSAEAAPREESIGQISNIETPSVSASQAVDAPKPAEPAVPTQDELLSSRYAAMARQEKQMRARIEAEKAKADVREAEFRAREEALKAREAEYQSKYIPKDTLQQDPLNALAAAGLSYDQITELMLAQQNSPANPVYETKIKSLEQTIKSLESKLDQTAKSFEDQGKASYDQAITQIRYDVRRAVKGNPDFETIEKTNSFNDVVDLIDKTYREGLNEDYPKGTVMDVYTAAAMVEKDISEDLYNYATGISKIKNRLSPAAEAKAAVTTQSQVQSKEPQLKTLTNSIQSSAKKLNRRDAAIEAIRQIQTRR